MADRLSGKIAVVFGAGSSGPGWGNGRAAAVAHVREGARVACIDLVEEAVRETAEIITRDVADAAVFLASGRRSS